MPRPMLTLSVILLLATPLWGDPPVQPKGERLLGFGINEGSIGFEKAFASAREAGLEFVELPTHWDDIEPKPEEYTNQWLDVADAYYPGVGTRMVISLNPIDTNRLRVPHDLRDKPLDDPEVIRRFQKAADYVLDRLPNTKLVAFAIGNEIDGHLGTDASQWKRYENFLRETSAHVRKRRPGVPVGTKIMAATLISRPTLAAGVHAHTDAVFATYYPLDGRFHVKPEESVRKDLQALLDAAGDRPLYLLEAGCPSSTELDSSDARQAEFVRSVFRFWDEHPRQLKAVNFNWLHDISQEEVQTYTKYYGASDRSFAQYLATLGLRSHDGQDKPAFRAMREETKARGW